MGDHKTSMLQDLEAGKRLELDCMTGAVAELAGQLGIDVPSVRTVHACAKLLDHLRQPRLIVPNATPPAGAGVPPSGGQIRAGPSAA